MIYKIGSRGDEVKQIQTRLNCIPDGIFGPITQEAVRNFQRENSLTVDGIVGEKTWSKLFPNTTLKKSTRKITEIIIHCSATLEGKEYDVEDIRRWHFERGFADCGYHYVITLDGTIQPGRSIDKVGAHCLGHNINSLGICYIGGLDESLNPKDTRTPAQKRAMLKLIKDLKTLYPGVKIHGHRDFAAKACPCFDATAEYSHI